MKLIKPFLLIALTALPHLAMAQVATTAGSNLTAWNGNSGATNNNNWNQLTNARVQATAGAPKADFGNCNSLIMRCAQPKCAGCTTIDVARPIVTGCVNSNATCKQYGNDLVDFIAAQLVANANSKAQQAELAAQQMAAQQAAAQSNAQIQQMQQQMANMQYQMQQQSAQQMAQMQAALEEQKAMVAAAQAEATAAKQENYAITSNVELTQSEQARAATGEVSAELLARERIQGQILSEIENAEDAMKNLKSTMQNIFSYAGCDSRGNNCRGPKRVSVFKDKAMQFFEPFDTVADAMYDALEKALAVGVDVSDVVMMLSGACNQWGKYMCVPTNSEGKHVPETYNKDTCVGGRSKKYGFVKGGVECTDGMIVPPQDDTRCTLTELIDADNNEGIERQWLDAQEDSDKLVRLGCATSSLESLSIFGRRRSKKQSTLDIDTLEMLINQDGVDIGGYNPFITNSGDSRIERIKYCGLSSDGYKKLVSAIKTKKFPKTICVSDDKLTAEAKKFGTYIGYFDFNLSPDYKRVSAANETECGKMKSDWEKMKGNNPIKECQKCDIKWTDGVCKLVDCGCIYVDGKGVTTYNVAGIADQERIYNCGDSGGNWDYENEECDCYYHSFSEGMSVQMNEAGRCIFNKRDKN
ncbi:MAG: hypothetical protein IKL14_04545 [Alphaproteobacteria bacterium]|nr:hypothetical protein [Alphaproteobacteria bacterium]